MQNIFTSTALNHNSVCSSCALGVTQIVQFIHNEQQQTTNRTEHKLTSAKKNTPSSSPLFLVLPGQFHCCETHCSLSVTVTNEHDWKMPGKEFKYNLKVK